MAKRKKDNTKRNWEDLEWEVGSIYATNVENGAQTYFVALKGNPLVLRTMVEGDLDAVFEKYKQSLNTKIIKETRKSVAKGTAIIVEAVNEDWSDSDTPNDIVNKTRVISGVGQIQGGFAEATLEDDYVKYQKYLQELITYVGLVKNKGRKPILTTKLL